MQRALVELLSAVRRAGLSVSPSESIDAMRAAERVGLAARDDLKRALSAVLVKRKADVVRFDQTFDDFFRAQGRTHGDLYERLKAAGFELAEVALLSELLRAAADARQGSQLIAALSRGGDAVERLLYESSERVGCRRLTDPERVGVMTMRVLDAARFSRAEAQLGWLRAQLRDALGARGEALADALAQELRQVRRRARDMVREQVTQEQGVGDGWQVPFAALEPDEVAKVERAVLSLSQRLLGRARVRARRARRGRLDGPRTLRSALRTGAVPFEPRFRRRSEPRRRLLVLCDVSDSVRESARFMLLFVHTVQRLFEDTQSLVFVSDVCDATAVFREQPAARAVELAVRGAIVDVTANSHYGRALSQLRTRYARSLTKRTTLVILGDGRTNHFTPGLEELLAIRRRVGRLVWFVPEPEARWRHGDSALSLYAPHADAMHAVYNLETLRRAVRGLC